MIYRFLDADMQREAINKRLANLEREHWDNHLTLVSLQGQVVLDPASISQVEHNLLVIERAHHAMEEELAKFIVEATTAGVTGVSVASEPVATDAQPT